MWNSLIRRSLTCWYCLFSKINETQCSLGTAQGLFTVPLQCELTHKEKAAQGTVDWGPRDLLTLECATLEVLSSGSRSHVSSNLPCAGTAWYSKTRWPSVKQQDRWGGGVSVSSSIKRGLQWDFPRGKWSQMRRGPSTDVRRGLFSHGREWSFSADTCPVSKTAPSVDNVFFLLSYSYTFYCFSDCIVWCL